ncbi:MAG: amino acid ABC transporter ATP-binding protein, partial [Deltaproteobacteria bacterium]|nr:amino acid ABC transporter ATP-binding protein [Deltaproteobacteria bacterium]
MIRVKNVCKTFKLANRKEVKALVNFSTHIKKGEVVVIIGPSGSGKSTFLRCLNRLEEIDSGEIVIDGVNIYDKKVNINKVREEIGMVFQLFNLFPHKTVLENITLAQAIVRKRQKKEAIEIARELLRKVGILEKENVYPSQLSGGQQQRVAIARALAMQPKIML